jgi:steroid delta-isomerase-like uncharacterized protein
MEVEVLKRAEEALVSLDAEELVSLYADDFVLEDTSSGDTITNKKELREYYERLFSLPEVRFINVTFFRCGDCGAGEWTWSGRSLGSGKDYSIKGASIFSLGEDEIKSESIFYDPRKAYV